MELVWLAAGLIFVTAAPYLAYLLLYAILRPCGSPADKTEASPTVSIVLPTYNEEDIIERKLDDIADIDYPTDLLDIVVIDSSDDATPEIIRAYCEEHNDFPALKLLEESERRGLAIALNEAYDAATGDIVVKTDCDSYVAPDAIAEAVANLADESIDAVTGQNAEVLGGSEVEAGYRGIQTHIQVLESHLDSTLIFHGPFSAFRNDAIVPIDPNSLADDTELALLMRRNGGRVIFDPAIAYQEAAHSDFAKRRKVKDRRAMGLIRLLVQHRDALFSYGRYGRLVLPFNWWFMIVSPWLVVLCLLAIIVAAVSVSGPFGLAIALPLICFVWLGQSDKLGPLQPLYSLFDTQVSLLVAAIRLMRGEGDGTWEVDDELREAFE